MADSPDPVVALLRGINVGGKGKVSMSELKAALADAGMGDARTYLQSGNVVLTPPRKSNDPSGAIEKVVVAMTGKGVRVIVRTKEEMAEVVSGNPFIADDVDPRMVHAVFLEREPESGLVAALDPERSPPDRFQVAGREIYVHYPGGSGRSKLSLDYFEKKLGIAGTARNWNTVTKLLAMLEE